MSTTMPMHVAPTFATVMQQQLRLLWLSRRPAFIALLLVSALVLIAAALKYHDASKGVLLFVQMAPAVLFTSGAWGILIWRDEMPRMRMYHWTLPADIATHELGRVAAGAVWLLLALVCYIVTGVVLALASGEGAALMRALPLILPHFLLSSFTMYLFLASLSTASNRPVEWLLGMFLGVQAVLLMAAILQRGALIRAFEIIGGPPYGFGWALVGGWKGAEVRMVSPERAELSLYYSEWLPVAVAWLIISAVLITLVARMRRRRA